MAVSRLSSTWAAAVSVKLMAGSAIGPDGEAVMAPAVQSAEG